jgi:hypothetical protein
MHELLIFFSVMGGLQVFGVLGILLGPVVVALGLAMFDAFRDEPGAESEALPGAGTGAPTPAVVAPAAAGAEATPPRQP